MYTRSKVLITGAYGRLGRDLVYVFENSGFNVLKPDRYKLDIIKHRQVKEYIHAEKPDIIIHCAAYTNVDKAESEKELCYLVNVQGTKTLVKCAKEIGAIFVYISTDYVFDGLSADPYEVHSPANPINYYGLTKRLGELAVTDNLEKYFIIRTSWLYGDFGNNFVKYMIEAAHKGVPVNVVTDQIGAPTYTEDLANFISKVLNTEKYGILHGVNSGYCSRYEFTKEIFNQIGYDVDIGKIVTSDLVSTAERPLNSKLRGSTEICEMCDWKDALSRYIINLNNANGGVA